MWGGDCLMELDIPTGLRLRSDNLVNDLYGQKLQLRSTDIILKLLRSHNGVPERMEVRFTASVCLSVSKCSCRC